MDQGLTNLGGIVGIVLAMLVTGPLNDWGIVWMSQRNRGIYEPEYRLVFMLGMLFGVFGYVGWAVGNDNRMPWIGAVACITYVLWHPSLSVALLTIGTLDHPDPSSLRSALCARLRPSVPTESHIPRGSHLISAPPGAPVWQHAQLQHGRLRRSGSNLPAGHARRQRPAHPLHHELREEHGPLRLDLFRQRHHHLPRCQGLAAHPWGVPGRLLARVRPDVRVREARAVVRECHLSIPTRLAPSARVRCQY